MCVCSCCCIRLSCFSTEGGIVKAPVQPQVMFLIEHDILSSHLYRDQFKCLDIGEKGSMAESWHKTSWEFQAHFLVEYLFIKAVFRWWLKNVLYGMLQIPGRLFKLTQLLANSFAFEDYSESALVSSSQKVHTGCDTMTRSHTEKQQTSLDMCKKIIGSFQTVASLGDFFLINFFREAEQCTVVLAVTRLQSPSGEISWLVEPTCWGVPVFYHKNELQCKKFQVKTSL